MAKATVDAVELMKSQTLRAEIKRMREMRLRIWLGIKLIALAAWVMNCNLEVAIEDAGDDD